MCTSSLDVVGHRRRTPAAGNGSPSRRVPGHTARVEPTEITAGRLHLRPWQDADVAALEQGLSDADVLRWTPLRPERARFVAEQASPEG